MPLGEWVLREACRAEPRLAGPLGCRTVRVAVNLSAAQFRQHDAARLGARRAARQAGVAPECLELEITESMVMQNAARRRACSSAQRDGRARLDRRLRHRLLQLGYLKRFPIDSLKIDRSFVRDVAVDPDDAAIVARHHRHGAQLGLKVVAEGVETERSWNSCAGWAGINIRVSTAAGRCRREAFEAFILARQGSRSRPLLAPA